LTKKENLPLKLNNYDINNISNVKRNRVEVLLKNSLKGGEIAFNLDGESNISIKIIRMLTLNLVHQIHHLGLIKIPLEYDVLLYKNIENSLENSSERRFESALAVVRLDQLQQTPSPYPYLARPTVSLSSPYPSPFPADSVFALRMQSMTAGAREQPRAHAVLCGEERETVEKGSAGTRRVFCGDGCCWRAK
jgi:hypothetical protein